MPNCQELTRMLASEQLADARWSKKFSARLHLLMCRHCRRYRAQLHTLGALARTCWGAEAHDAERLEQLERKILERF